jgi:hypothetical protein
VWAKNKVLKRSIFEIPIQYVLSTSLGDGVTIVSADVTVEAHVMIIITIGTEREASAKSLRDLPVF